MSSSRVDSSERNPLILVTLIYIELCLDYRHLPYNGSMQLFVYSGFADVQEHIPQVIFTKRHLCLALQALTMTTYGSTISAKFWGGGIADLRPFHYISSKFSGCRPVTGQDRVENSLSYSFSQSVVI